MKTILVIDGDYFANRQLGIENMADKINNLETTQEQRSFSTSLNTALLNLYRSFSPYVDNLVFTKDSSSWRKLVEPHKPYFFKKDAPIPLGYKENRKSTKEESSINYNNFNKLYDDFVDDLKSKITVFHVDGLEGDDIMLLLAKAAGITTNPDEDFQIIIFANDGDIEQTVNHRTILMRNIKSKDCPKGEFVINFKMFEKVFESTIEDQFLNYSSIIQYYKKLFSMDLFTDYSVKRSLNEGIRIAKPFKVAFVKSVCGDKKDNILPILRWFKGDKKYGVTEKMIEKVLKIDGNILNEDICKNFLRNPKELKLFFSRLIIETKQQGLVTTEQLEAHFKHNLRINVLIESNIPKNCVINFREQFDIIKPSLLNNKYTIDDLVKVLTVVSKDSAVDIMESSIPKELL